MRCADCRDKEEKIAQAMIQHMTADLTPVTFHEMEADFLNGRERDYGLQPPEGLSYILLYTDSRRTLRGHLARDIFHVFPRSVRDRGGLECLNWFYVDPKRTKLLAALNGPAKHAQLFPNTEFNDVSKGEYCYFDKDNMQVFRIPPGFNDQDLENHFKAKITQAKELYKLLPKNH
jgi:hypothetical protein